MGAQEVAGAAKNLPPLPAEVPGSATLYSVSILGDLDGRQATWTTPDGKLHAFFQMDDRGRGARVISTITLDGEGIPVAETIRGVDYWRSPADEDYSLQGNTARWKNRVEQGEKKILGRAFYASMNGAPIDLALLAHTALVNGGEIPLLPEGKAQVRSVSDCDIEASGQKKHVVLYSVAGLGLSPNYVWLDEDNTFFAATDGWAMTTRQGWESTREALQKVQNEVIQARSAELAGEFAHPAPKGIVFTHANLFDATTAAIVPDQNVTVMGNRIRAMGAPTQVTAPAGAEVIDAAGKTLLPGLWDMHAHVTDNQGMLNLAAGVTTVRDMMNDTETLLARRKRIEAETEIGTRILLAGVIESPGPYQAPTKVLVTTESEARAAVDNYVRLGYSQIKIYSSVKPELVPAIIDEAHQQGLRVSGHIPAGMTASQCVELGFDEIQHSIYLMLNFWPEVKDTNTSRRITEVARRGADLDLNSPQVQSFIKLLQERHITLDPTLNFSEAMFLNRPGEIPLGYRPEAKRLPPLVRRWLMTSFGLTPPPGMDERYRQSFAKMMELVGKLYRAGIPIEAGTDTVAGFGLQRELELDVLAGIPPAKVLQNATLNAARIMKQDSQLGSIAPGKLADMTLVDGNPLANISEVRKTILVVKNGVIYKPAELYTALGIQP
jgi:imidazolonepropionase-like amidohydrolase